MKKSYMSYLLIIMTLLLTACGGNEKKSDGPTELTVGTWSTTPEETKMLQKQFAAFEKANPGVKVNHRVYVNNYEQNIQTDYAAGIAPDVFYVDIASTANYVDKKVIAPLDEYLTEETTSLHDKVAINGFKGADGKLYGLPKDCATLVLFHNEDYFKAAGIEKAPVTWDELVEVSKKLIAAKDAGKLPKEFVHPMSVIFDGVRVAPFIYSNGGDMVKDGSVDLTSDETKEAMEFYYSLVRDGYADIPQNQGTASLVSSFAEGKSAMIMSGTWAEAFFQRATPDLNYDKSMLPYSKEPSTMFLSVAFAVNSQTSKKAEAADFVKFITGVEGQRILIENEHALPTVMSLKNDFLEKYPHKQAFIDSMEYATPWNWGTATIRMSTEMKLYGEKAVMDSNISVDGIAQEITNKF